MTRDASGIRIAHVCRRFSKLSETFVYSLICNLERRGSDNRVITGQRLNAVERPFAPVTVIPEPPLSRLLFFARKRFLQRYAYGIAEHAYARALESIQPDVILAHFGGTGLAVRGVARRLKIPLIVTFHAFDLFSRNFPYDIYRTLWPDLLHAVTVSEFARARLVGFFGCPAAKIHVVHCGVDPAFFRSEAKVKRTPSIHLLTVGRLVEKKGTPLLVEAVGRLCTEGADLHLDIYGDGPLGAVLRRQIARAGLDDRVRLRGAVAHRDLPTIMNAHDVFALASHRARNGDREGIPVSILEAQAAALPVLTTRHAGIPEAIPPAQHRFLADENNVDDLTDKLARLLRCRHEWPAIGRAGQEFVKREFSADTEAERYLHLCGNRPSATWDAGKEADYVR